MDFLSQSRARDAMRLLGRIYDSVAYCNKSDSKAITKLFSFLLCKYRCLRTVIRDAEAHSNDEGWQGH